MTTIALLGYGRIGRRVYRLTQAEKNYKVIYAIDNYVEQDSIDIPIIRTDQFEETIKQQRPDVIIDFSHPNATLDIAPKALANNIGMVVCTAGFTEEQRIELKKAADRYPSAAFLLAPNITPGINLLMIFTKIAGQILNDYDIQITDYHFKEKKDCPSGTAKKLARELNNDGVEATVNGVRAGNIVGIHTALFAGSQDQIEITHQSYSKDIFAKSALDAAKSIIGRSGYLEMKDILNYKEIIKKYMGID